MKAFQLVLLCVLALNSIGSAQQLNLRQCIELAIKTHPQVKLSQSQLDGAVARHRQAKAQLRPEVNFSGMGRNQGPTLTFTVPLPPPMPPREVIVMPEFTHTLGLEFRQNVYSGGRYSAAIRGASYLVNAAYEALNATQAQLVLRVTEAYADVLAGQALEEAAKQAMERVRLVLKTAKARFEAGVTPKFDVLRAETELAVAEEQLLAARNGVALAKAMLNQLLGRQTDASLELEPLPEPFEVEPETLQSEPFVKQAKLNRSELKVTDWQIKFTQERVKFARMDNQPLAFLTGDYRRQTATGFASNYSWGVNLMVQIPIFDSGRRQGALEEQEAMLQQSLAQKEQLERQIALEVEQAVKSFQLALQRLRTARVAVKSAEEAYRLVQVRYEAGVGTLVEVWDAQVAFTRAQASEVQALYDSHKAFARLVYATGLTEAEVKKMLNGREIVR